MGGAHIALATARRVHHGDRMPRHVAFDPGPLLFWMLALPVRMDPAHGVLWGAALVVRGGDGGLRGGRMGGEGARPAPSLLRASP